MNRQEKRAIRLQIINILDHQCKGCEKAERAVSYGRSYCHSTCAFGIRLLELSSNFEEKKRMRIKKPSWNDGVKRGRWTASETEFVLRNRKHLTVAEIGAQLNRTKRSIRYKLDLLRQEEKQVKAHVN